MAGSYPGSEPYGGSEQTDSSDSDAIHLAYSCIIQIPTPMETKKQTDWNGSLLVTRRCNELTQVRGPTCEYV